MIFTKIPTPIPTSGGTSIPPTLCEIFQIPVFVPHSFFENHFVITILQGGAPIPCTIPLTTSNVTIIPNEDAKPKQIFTSPDKINRLR